MRVERRIDRRASLIVGALVVLAVMLPGTARAASPIMTTGGDPTPAEQSIIDETWDRFSTSFRGFEDCMGPLEVRVVDRAEDVNGTGNSLPIAAFYQFPPDAKVFIEHGKVSPRVLIHEFAHHLDISCGLGEGTWGDRFRSAQGLPSERGWIRGSTWSAVPAEVFAESVVAYFGGDPRVGIGDQTMNVVESISSVPDPLRREWQRSRLAEADRAAAADVRGRAVDPAEPRPVLPR
jgi:hypothetical protein